MEKILNDKQLNYVFDSSLNPASLQEFEIEVKSSLEGINELNLDFSNLEYISSSVVRLLIDLHLILESQSGKMNILHPNEEVYEILDMTGLTSTLSIIK